VDSPLVEATFILLILREHEALYDISAQLTALKPRVKIVYVDAVTEGAACTALLARDLINNDDPVFIVNSDQFVEWSADAFWAQMVSEGAAGVDGNVLCFRVPMALNDIKWSYALVNEAGHITDIQEKVVISENATVGFYYWRRGCNFVTSADEMVAAGAKVNGEYYVAPVYNIGAAKGHKYTVSFCDKMWGLGVPEDLTRFLSDYARPRLGAQCADWPTPYPRPSAPLRFIAHRGNLEGPNKAQENEPSYLRFALAAGFDVECDAWYLEQQNEWRLGHDEPQYAISYDFLLQPGLWVHCKNGPALRIISADARIHSFWHDTDDYTLTSRGLPWIYPNKPLLGPRSIAVMFSDSMPLLAEDIFGICCDEVGPLRRAYLAAACAPAAAAGEAAASLLAPANRVQLVVFDLDGVLVDSRDLHYEALNAAIEAEAGTQYVITRAEHESIYDGLSTNQKLRLMSLTKELPLEAHARIWQRKQELTDVLVRQQLAPVAHVTQLLQQLKRCGYPVAVASNCIRSSVRNILDSIGLLPYIDACFSNEDVAHAKPEPDIYIKACASFGLQPHQALVVEDSTKGFEAALRAGCHLLKVDGTASVTAAAVFRRLQEVDAAPVPITVVIPLAGNSPQAWLDGPESAPAELPLFLTDVRGRPALEWAVRSIKSARFPMRFVFVVKDAQAAALKLESMCVKATGYEPTTVVRARAETLGALKTVLQARQLLAPGAPLLIFDGSHIVDWRAGGCVDDVLCSRADGAVTVCSSSDPRWSYVRMQSNSNAVLEVHEKIAVSNSACSGLYFWRRAADFLEAADAVVAADTRTRGLFFLAPTFNHTIRGGAAVEAVPIAQTWSLRTASEVSFFAEHFFSNVACEALDATYHEMVGRHAASIAASGFGCDPGVLAAPDARRCLALYALCTPANFRPAPKLRALVDTLATQLGRRHVLYRAHEAGAFPADARTAGALHFTFMQMIGFESYAAVTLPAGYREAVEATLLRHLPAFHIHFSKVIVTAKSVMLVGHPTVDVNWSREQLRAALGRAGYPLLEPYKTDIVHCTLLRFASDVTPAEAAALTAAVRDCGAGALGSMSVAAMQLSAASWKMTEKELAAHDCGAPIALLRR
jgi:HAD superfamily hydrolase (TIGR01509 family)